MAGHNKDITTFLLGTHYPCSFKDRVHGPYPYGNGKHG